MTLLPDGDAPRSATSITTSWGDAPSRRPSGDVDLYAGDRDAAQDQVRAALTSGARGLLLLRRVIPLSRSELPDQLRDAGLAALATDLEVTIYATLALGELSSSLMTLKRAAQSAQAVAV